MLTVRALGIDAAFSNMGFAVVTLTINDKGQVPTVACEHLHLVQTEAIDAKQVRKSSNELRRAKELHTALHMLSAGCQFAFAEVPSGSQSASAARSLGIAVGVLASCPVPLIEVSPMEVKRAVIANPKVKVPKGYIIDWAVKRWPTANWIRERGKPNGRVILDNEHCADALATVMAGIATPAFQNILTMLAHHETSSTPNHRPASGSGRVRLV